MRGWLPAPVILSCSALVLVALAHVAVGMTAGRVLTDLDAVPPGSPHGAEAQRLAAAIRLSRGPMVRTPLALGSKAGERHPALEAKLAACARLAQLAGADGGVDRRALEALEACRH